MKESAQTIKHKQENEERREDLRKMERWTEQKEERVERY